MYLKRSSSDVPRAMKAAGLVLGSTLLFACGGEPEVTPGDSSNAVSSSSTPVVSSSSAGNSSVAPTNETEGSMLSNGTFSNGQGNFTTGGSTQNGATVTFNGVADFSITGVSSNPWSVELLHDVSVVANQQYTVCFEAWTDEGSRSIGVLLDEGPSNYGNITNEGTLSENISGTRQSYSMTFTVNQTDTTARLQFRLGQSDIDVTLDNVGMYEGTSCGGGGSNSSVVVSSSSSSVSNGEYDNYSPNITQGEIEFETQCKFCHVSDEFILEVADYETRGDLFNYIRDNMPIPTYTDCEGQCAADVTAYMFQRLDAMLVVSQCNPQDPVTYGVRGVRLLTAQEYKNSLEFLGLAQPGEITEADLADDFVLTKSKFPVHNGTIVNKSRAEIFALTAEKLAASAASRIRNNCSSTTQCMSNFDTIARKLFRRPLTSAETSTYRSMFETYGPADGMEVALTAAMSSPNFLYRSEIGVPRSSASGAGLSNVPFLNQADSNSYVLDNYEFATALAFMYTGTTPDDTLLSAAANNRLSTETEISGQIERLLNTDRGRDHMGRFAGYWMRTDDVLEADRPDFPDFTDQVKESMAEEARRLFTHVFYDETVPFEDFYGGDFAVVNQTLANFYGDIDFFSGQDIGDGWRVVHNLENRGGIITTGAFMTANAGQKMSGPILRAVDIRELMLCHHIDPPPNDLNAQREDLLQQVVSKLQSGNLTSREYFEDITDDPACDICHAEIINPLFGVEDFDQVGRFRETMRGLEYEGTPGNYGLQVDASGVLYGINSTKDTASVTFHGSKDLGQKLATLALAPIRECMAVNAFRWMTGMPLDQISVVKQNDQYVEPQLTQEQVSDFACAKTEIEGAYMDNGSDVKETFKSIGTLELIRFRK